MDILIENRDKQYIDEFVEVFKQINLNNKEKERMSDFARGILFAKRIELSDEKNITTEPTKPLAK